MSDYIYFDRNEKDCSFCPLLGYKEHAVCRGGDRDFKDPDLYFSGSVANASVNLANARTLKYYHYCSPEDSYYDACSGPWKDCTTFRVNLSKLEKAEKEKRYSEYEQKSSGDKKVKEGGGFGIIVFIAILIVLFYLWKNNML